MTHRIVAMKRFPEDNAILLALIGEGCILRTKLFPAPLMAIDFFGDTPPHGFDLVWADGKDAWFGTEKWRALMRTNVSYAVAATAGNPIDERMYAAYEEAIAIFDAWHVIFNTAQAFAKER